MIKLTRLNRSTVAVNPDHISWIDASPDTTLCLLGGDKLLVRESIDELIDKVIQFRRLVRIIPSASAREDLSLIEGDPLPEDALRALRRSPSSMPAGRASSLPPHGGKGG